MSKYWPTSFSEIDDIANVDYPESSYLLSSLNGDLASAKVSWEKFYEWLEARRSQDISEEDTGYKHGIPQGMWQGVLFDEFDNVLMTPNDSLFSDGYQQSSGCLVIPDTHPDFSDTDWQSMAVPTGESLSFGALPWLFASGRWRMFLRFRVRTPGTWGGWKMLLSSTGSPTDLERPEVFWIGSYSSSCFLRCQFMVPFGGTSEEYANLSWDVVSLDGIQLDDGNWHRLGIYCDEGVVGAILDGVTYDRSNLTSGYIDPYKAYVWGLHPVGGVVTGDDIDIASIGFAAEWW